MTARTPMPPPAPGSLAELPFARFLTHFAGPLTPDGEFEHLHLDAPSTPPSTTPQRPASASWNAP